MVKLPQRHHGYPDAACCQSELGGAPRQQVEALASEVPRLSGVSEQPEGTKEKHQASRDYFRDGKPNRTGFPSKRTRPTS